MISESPLVSVLIPCYNAQDYIADALESVINQIYPNLEIIVVDDGSTDSSRRVLLDYAARDNRIILHFQDNRGPSAARNKAFELSKGEWIQYLDADDLLSVDKIERQVEAASRCENEPKIVYGDIFNIDHLGSIEKQKFPSKNFSNPFDFIFYDTFGCGNTGVHLFPRIIIENISPWEEGVNIYEDLDFCCRAVALSSYMVYSEDAIYYYRKPGYRNTLSSERKYFVSSQSWYMLEKVSHEILSKIQFENKRYLFVLSQFIFRWVWNIYPALPEERRIALALIKKTGIDPRYLNISPQSQACLNLFGLKLCFKILYFKRKLKF